MNSAFSFYEGFVFFLKFSGVREGESIFLGGGSLKEAAIAGWLRTEGSSLETVGYLPPKGSAELITLECQQARGRTSLRSARAKSEPGRSLSQDEV